MNFLNVLLYLFLLHPALPPQDSLTELCRELNALNTKVRDGSIERAAAVATFQKLMPQIRQQYLAQQKQSYSTADWIFPVKGYSARQIGGTNGSGYIAGKYNYFDGNRHTGHPAHDIFVYDANQDALDDRTKQPVEILSVSAGVVIATETNWQADSPLRGGNYIWIYDPFSDGLFYYAHNQKVLTEPGALVVPGQKIAEMGRSGLNAFKQRSPTHLHLMYLKMEKNLPVARDIYKELLKVKTAK